MNTTCLASLTVLAAGLACAAGPREFLPDRVPAQAPDVLEPLSPAAIELQGWLGARVAANEQNRLLQVDLEPLLAGYRKKPGSHPWIGEHIGKWMHAATLAWANTGDPDLKKKLDWAAAELVGCQEPDGYLGTYTPDKRFGLFPQADWDVWSHKYNLLGLLTYAQFTGDGPALAACRRMGDLLIATFGPGKKSILSAGTHVGMAATSVLEPVVRLYRQTGDSRYLEFARYLIRSWDEPNGPRIVDTLLKTGAVNKTANGKAYEMLSNLVGLCEFVRATGERRYLVPVLKAWEDVVSRRLYLTGSASQGEHFRDDFHLPNQPGANVSETCVTTTWIQLNAQLLRLTGEARFGDQLEKTLFNHLAAAQRPDGAQWCYFTPLEGTKSYGPGINCCVSSGPRGMALAPQQTYLRVPGSRGQPDAIAVNLFGPSRATLEFKGGSVVLEQQTEFPRSGEVTLVVHVAKPTRFGLWVRDPGWAGPLGLTLAGSARRLGELRDGWVQVVARTWRDGDRVKAVLKLEPRWQLGEHGNQGKAALSWGPLILAYDQKRDPQNELPSMLGLVNDPAIAPFRLKAEEPVALVFQGRVRSVRDPVPRVADLVPFADAGSTGGRFQVWLRAPGAPLAANVTTNDSVFAFADETRSRPGNVEGSIVDGDEATFAVTFDARPQAEAWFAVERDSAVEIRRVVFRHGKTFHDGGWFDASAGKPRIQVKRTKGGAWETLGELRSYPATTAADSRGLTEGQRFVEELGQPERVIALRLIGKPASGDNPGQAFASCAELGAFAR